MMRAGKETSLVTQQPDPDASQPSSAPTEHLSAGGASLAEENGKSSQSPRTPGKVKLASADPEWLIDDSTKSFYLSLFTSSKAKTPQPKAALSRLVRRKETLARGAAAQSNMQRAELAIKLGDVRASRAYVLTILTLVLSFGLYQIISRTGGSRRESGTNRHISLAAASPAPAATGQTAARGPVALPPLLPAGGLIGTPTLNVAPTLILADVQPQQAATYTLTVTNLTPQEFTFELEGKDLVLKDGKAVFLPPGEVPDSVAVNLTFSKKSVNVKPAQSGSLDVTVSRPIRSQVRGVLIVLKGSDQISVTGETAMTASLGTLISFVRPETIAQEATVSSQTDPTPTASFTVSQWLSDRVPECRGAEGGPTAGRPVGNALSTPSGGGQR